MDYEEKMSFTEAKVNISVTFNSGKNRYDWVLTREGNVLAKGSSVVLPEARKMALGAFEVISKGVALM